MEKTEQKKITNSDYEALISKSFENKSIQEKTIVNGSVISFDNDIVTIDVGLKSEGRIPLSEFSRPGQKPDINVGDSFEVYIESIDNSNGETVLSREKAVKQKAWNTLQDSFDNNKVVTGTPFNRVKGGMSVDLNGVVAFLPGSQIDTRQIIKDTKELLNKPLDLMILKMDKFRGNIVVSRKAISEVELKEQRKELLSSINEGSIKFEDFAVDIKGDLSQDWQNLLPFGQLDLKVHGYKTFLRNFFDTLELQAPTEHAQLEAYKDHKQQQMFFDFLEKINGNKSELFDLNIVRNSAQMPIFNNLSFKEVNKIYKDAFNIKDTHFEQTPPAIPPPGAIPNTNQDNPQEDLPNLF